MSRRRGPQRSWTSKVPHGNAKNPHLIAPGLRNHFVYLLADESGEVIYVGCTRNPEQRWRDHRTTKRWSSEVASKRMVGPYDYPTARRIERELQDLHRPRYDARFRASRIHA